MQVGGWHKPMYSFHVVRPTAFIVACMMWLMLQGHQSSANADDVTKQLGPSFDCSRAHDPLALLICSSPPLSRLDLIFNQAYQALRQQSGPQGQKTVRQEAIDFQAKVLATCEIPASGTFTPTPSATSCVFQAYEAQRSTWLTRLTSPASDEARRPIEQHIEFQRRLQALGFLPGTATVDGVYGPATREAIAALQRSRGAPETGWIDGDDQQLLGDTPKAGEADLRPIPPSNYPTSTLPFQGWVPPLTAISAQPTCRDFINAAPAQLGAYHDYMLDVQERMVIADQARGCRMEAYDVNNDWTYRMCFANPNQPLFNIAQAAYGLRKAMGSIGFMNGCRD
jgi:hypothetical protein